MTRSLLGKLFFHLYISFIIVTFNPNLILCWLQKVCDCLLRQGTLTLAQIIRFTELSREHVINCLRVLIHQNCVQAFAIQQEGAFGEAPRIVTQYIALFDNMIHKLRAAKFIQIVSDELGKDCLGIFEGLLQHGRLSINQIIDRHEQTAGSSDFYVVRESFNRLLNARFIERCPAPEPFLAPPAEGETLARKRSAKSKIAEERQTTEQRALAAAAPIESMRFLMDMDDLSLEKGEEGPKSVAVGEKRKQDGKSDEDVLDANKKKEVLWRVNFEELVCHMRHKACISYVKTRINNEAGIVLGAMLELRGRSGILQKAEKSPYLSLNAIYQEVIKKEGGLGMDLDHISASREELGCQTLSTGLDESFSIDINGIIEMAQNEEVESVVLKRYGREAYRIFGLLAKAGRLLESDKISEITSVEKKDVIKILYRLWKDEYLHMEKVNTSGAKQSLFLLWRVNKQPLVEHVLDEMYLAALNLRRRIAQEQDQGKEVLQLPREKLVGDLEKKYNRLGKVRVILESSLINLDDAIMLFHDF